MRQERGMVAGAKVKSEAKVGKGTIYLYFENKDDLFFQTATWGFEELCELLK